LPNIKAAEKWWRQSEKRTARNKDTVTRLKTLYKKAASGGDAAAVTAVESAFDKAAGKGIIHPNKAARKKSRLARVLQRASTTPPKSVKAKGSKSTRPGGGIKKTAKK
jgi:small subunit ribosomal protein S20